MQLKKFIERFTPSARRSDIDEVVDLISAQLSVASDVWGRYADDVKARRITFKSDYANEFAKSYTKVVRNNRSMVESIADNLANANIALGALKEKYLDKSAGVVARSMPLQTATVYHLLAIFGFAAEYSTALMLGITNIEAGTGNSLAPNDARYLERQRNSFLQSMDLIGAASKDLDKIIAGLPNVDIDAETIDRVISVNGISKIDPLRSNLISLNTNPFYFVGMKWASYLALKHKKLVEEKRLLEYRLLQLQERQREETDPRLEKSIDFYSEELKKVKAKIAQLEE